MDYITLFQLIIILLIGIMHLISKHISFDFISFEQFLSFSAGFSMTSIFLYSIPKMYDFNLALSQSTSINNSVNWGYLLPLVSFSAFYIIDHLVSIETNKNKSESLDNQANNHLFYVQIAFFAIYNFFIGFSYSTPFESVFYTLVLSLFYGLHFVTNDWTLRYHHKNTYDRIGRYLLSASIILGFVVGIIAEPSEFIILGGEALVLGGLLLNTTKKEMPSEKSAGVSGYLSGFILASILYYFI